MSSWDTVVMLSWPVVGWTSAPSMSTTTLPSYSPRTGKVGPGPSETYGTVTNAISTPKATMGAKATSSVDIRLFTPPRVDGAHGGVHSERDGGRDATRLR